MKKSKWIPAVAAAVVLLGITSSCSSLDGTTEMQSSQNVQETIESSENELARNFENTEDTSEPVESEPMSPSDSSTELSSKESESSSVVEETTTSESKTIAEIPESVVEETVPSAEPAQTSAPETVSLDANSTIHESEAIAQPSSEPEPAPTTDNQGGNGENFNTYDNPEQQNTAELVLNTNTKKIHNPWCTSVAKIAPKNFETTTLSVAELEAQGYVKCKQKGDW